MKIVLSTKPIKYPLTGIGRYTYELAMQLSAASEIEELKYYNGAGFSKNLPDLSKLSTAPAFTKVATEKIQRLVSKNKLVVELYRALKFVTDRDSFRGMDDYLYHGTNFFVPNFPGASVVTIHDISVFTMPEFHPKERVNYLVKEIETSIDRASMIVTDSQYLKDEVELEFGVPSDQITVTKLACGSEFRPRSQDETNAVLSSFGLEHGKYALYAGTIEPRKNLANLLRAYGRISQADRAKTPLVFAGFAGWNNQEIMDLIAAGKREGWVKHLGFVTDHDLPILFSGSRLFLFPSLYEGFGLPVLEAMASGVPVITSKRGSLPEVGGQAVLYAEPEDIDDLTNAIKRGLADVDWRQFAIKAGMEHAQTFSWHKCAQDTIAVYRAAFERYNG